MSQPFLGQIGLFAFNFAPSGWHMCDGSLMAISQNQALFALIGTCYGGNGTTTFALPDLRSRSPVCQGSGPGLPTYTIGQNGGTTTMSLTAANLPAHTHPATLQVATAGRGVAPVVPAAGNYLETTTTVVPSPVPTLFALTGVAVGVNSGSSAPFSLVEPYLALNYCIALRGLFPARN